MATRARIGIVNPDGTITSIYTHNDGYISHHGPLLLNHWNTPEKINALMALGGLSVLGKKLGEKHDFDMSYTKRNPDWCKSYARDRDDHDAPALIHPDKAGFMEAGEQYTYLFESGKWWVYVGDENGENETWKDLALETVTDRLTA